MTVESSNSRSRIANCSDVLADMNANLGKLASLTDGLAGKMVEDATQKAKDAAGKASEKLNENVEKGVGNLLKKLDKK